jgi:hypothetical protein
MFIIKELLSHILYPILLSTIIVSTIFISLKVVNILNISLALGSIFIIFKFII